VRPELDARHEGQALLAFIDGLGLELLCHPEPATPEQQRALVGRTSGAYWQPRRRKRMPQYERDQ
jgi:hypothetical protein